MSEIDTKYLREVCEKASPAPWIWKSYQTYLMNGAVRHDHYLNSPNKPNKMYPSQQGIIVVLEQLLTDDTAVFRQEDKDFIAASRTALPALLDELDALRAQVADLREQLETIKVAAHMPEDYQYGLPSWINQRLYMAYIGAYISPILLEQIEKGQITFPNSPAERENADLRRQLAQHEGEMEI